MSENTNEQQEVNNQRLFNGLSIQITEPISGFETNLKGYKRILEFFKREYEFWNKSDKKEGVLKNYLHYFENAINRMEGFKKNNSQNVDEGYFKANWNEIGNYLVRKTTDAGHIIFFSTTTEARFMFEQFQTHETQGNVAYNFFAGKNTDLNTKHSFIGYLKAYEFSEQDESKIVKRRKHERTALRDIRKEAVQMVNDISFDFEKSKETFSKWKDKFIQEHEKSQILRKENLTEFIKDKSTVLKDLESVYKDKLSLEAPVQYWKTRIRKYRFQGIVWLTFLTLVVYLIARMLYNVLYDLPAAFHYKLFAGEPEAIKGIIIFATIISFGAYLAKTFTRLTFSSFHLQRDAEEREALTMVYLALIKDKSIPEEELKLVLQSIFSRADTGLIRPEGSPTMPGVGNIIGRLGGK